jgi:hypothetical protein
VSAAVWESGQHWFPIHVEPNVARFEIEHGLEQRRYAYDARCFAGVLEHKRALVAEHAGYHDLFMPIIHTGRVIAILATGPFALARPTSATVLEHWHWLTKRRGHLAEPEFARYLSASLATLVLDGESAKTFERLVGCLARFMAGEGSAEEQAKAAPKSSRIKAKNTVNPWSGFDSWKTLGTAFAKWWTSVLPRAGPARCEPTV